MAKPRDPAAAKAAKAEQKAASKAASKQRRSQLWQAFQIQRKEDKRLLPYMIGAFVLIVAASAVFGVLSGHFTGYMMIPLGVVLGALVVFIIFGRRAQTSVYRTAAAPSYCSWAMGRRPASNPCSPRKRSAPPGSSATSRSTTSWSATAKAKCR